MTNAPTPAGMAEDRIIEAIWSDICDRKGFDLNDLDDEVQDDIRSSWKVAILAAQPSAGAEPVATVDDGARGGIMWGANSAALPHGTHLYTHPAPVLTAGDGLHWVERYADGGGVVLTGYDVNAEDQAEWDVVHLRFIAKDGSATTSSYATPVQPDSGGVVEALDVEPMNMGLLRSAICSVITDAVFGSLKAEGESVSGDYGRVWDACHDAAETLMSGKCPQVSAPDRPYIAALAPVAAEDGEKDKLRIAVEALEPFALLAPGDGRSPVRMSDPLSKWFTIAQFVDADEALSALRTEPTGGGEGA